MAGGLVLVCGRGALGAGEDDDSGAPPQSWLLETGVDAVHLFDSDIDDSDNEVSVDRVAVNSCLTYAPERRQAFRLNLGYEHHDYHFTELAGRDDPWDGVQKLSVDVPIRLGLTEHWSLFAVPSVAFTAEEGADWDDAGTVGGMLGFVYRVNDRFRIGPAVVASSEIEDDATVMPSLIVDWQINDRLRFRTGGAPQGALAPGANLTWTWTEKTRFVLAAGREKLRFRLDDNGVARNGVGEDMGYPLSLGVTHRLGEHASLAVMGGAKFGGELTLEDVDGDEIVEKDYDPQPFVGISLQISF